MTEDLQPVFEHEVLLGSVVCADAGASEALRSRVIDGLVRFVKNPEMHAEGLQMNALTQDSSEPEKIVFHRSLQAGKVSFEDRVTVTQDAVIFDVSRQQALPASRLTVRLIEREGVFLLRFSYEGEPGQNIRNMWKCCGRRHGLQKTRHLPLPLRTTQVFSFVFYSA